MAQLSVLKRNDMPSSSFAASKDKFKGGAPIDIGSSAFGQSKFFLKKQNRAATKVQAVIRAFLAQARVFRHRKIEPRLQDLQDCERRRLEELKRIAEQLQQEKEEWPAIVRKEMEESEEVIDMLKKQIEDMKKENEEMKQQVKPLKKKAKEIQQETKKYNEDSFKIEMRNHKLVSENKYLQEEYDRYKWALENGNRAKEEMEHNLTKVAHQEGVIKKCINKILKLVEDKAAGTATSSNAPRAKHSSRHKFERASSKKSLLEDVDEGEEGEEENQPSKSKSKSAPRRATSMDASKPPQLEKSTSADGSRLKFSRSMNAANGGRRAGLQKSRSMKLKKAKSMRYLKTGEEAMFDWATNSQDLSKTETKFEWTTSSTELSTKAEAKYDWATSSNELSKKGPMFDWASNSQDLSKIGHLELEPDEEEQKKEKKGSKHNKKEKDGHGSSTVNHSSGGSGGSFFNWATQSYTNSLNGSFELEDGGGKIEPKDRRRRDSCKGGSKELYALLAELKLIKKQMKHQQSKSNDSLSEDQIWSSVQA